MYTVTVKIVEGLSFVTLVRDGLAITSNYPRERMSGWKNQYMLTDEQMKALEESANQQIEARKAEMRAAHQLFQPQTLSQAN